MQIHNITFINSFRKWISLHEQAEKIVIIIVSAWGTNNKIPLHFIVRPIEEEPC